MREQPTTLFPIDTARAENAPSLKKTLAIFAVMIVTMLQVLDSASK